MSMLHSHPNIEYKYQWQILNAKRIWLWSMSMFWSIGIQKNGIAMHRNVFVWNTRLTRMSSFICEYNATTRVLLSCEI